MQCLKAQLGFEAELWVETLYLNEGVYMTIDFCGSLDESMLLCDNNVFLQHNTIAIKHEKVFLHNQLR